MARPQPREAGRQKTYGGTGANVLGPSLKVRGRLSGEGDLRIEGTVEGDVRVTGTLDIDGKGSVDGNVNARAVTLSGALTGDVHAEGEVAILAGARVIGNMHGAEISLEEGATFSGRIDAEFELPDGMGGGAVGRATRGRR
jgi:cytoskeletal protein CcmA (bactofilin family)